MESNILKKLLYHNEYLTLNILYIFVYYVYFFIFKFPINI